MSTYELVTNEKKYGLAHFDAAYRALAEAVRIEDLVPIEKWATLALAYAKEAHDREKELLAARLRLHAQRKAGHALTVTAGNGERAARGGNGSNQHEQMSPAVTFAPTLADLGISRNESSKWQKLAAIPETDFEATMADSLDNHGTVTTAEVLRAHALRDKWRNDLRDTLEAVEVKEAKALAGRYDVIDIDPPWHAVPLNRHVRPDRVGVKYPTMSLDEIRETVGGLLARHAAADCHVFLWVPVSFVVKGLELLAAWDVRFLFQFIWHKPGGHQPFELPQFNYEAVLYGRIGSPAFIDTKNFFLCFSAPRGGHSEKPEEWYATLRRVTAGRRLAMFSRRLIEGFDGWGKEAPDVGLNGNAAPA